ncbi:hypothetical protein M3Y94_00532200 [Aphelenchoides besseyi]|nr:hypothetical protein M3Y94_00532200 [Aphelenchoides besseyi]
MYTVVKDVSNRFRTRYKIQSTSMTTPEVVNFSEIVRAHHISKADLNVLVDLLACLQNGCWYVRRPYAERLGIAGKPDVEITIRDAKEPTTSQMICIILGFFILIIVFVDLFVTYIVLGNLSTEDNAELSKESIALVAKMNRTTLDHYFKELVANEMINAVDHPLAAEGIAHMFWFESNLKNRTTLDEYVDRMKPTQQSIFYAYDHSKSDIEQMSNVQSLLESGIEVLFVTSPLDKRVIDRIDMFRGKLFVDTKRLISIKNETAILAL